MSKLPSLIALKLKLDGEVETSLPRPYLGMSQLGGPCRRALWYYFRWCYTRTITQKQKRIFARGDLEEARIIKDLTAAGIHFYSPQGMLIGFAGHCRGHTDGKVSNVPGFGEEILVAEFKTAKASSFDKFVKKGCKVANRQYYCQSQTYMKHEKLTKTLFIVTNKDTEERYYEIIIFEPGLAEELDAISIDVISTDIPPPKIGGPTWFECKWCDAYKVCHFNEPVIRNCRNCIRSVIKSEGVWGCTYFEKDLTLEEQAIDRKGHNCYIPLVDSTGVLDDS